MNTRDEILEVLNEKGLNWVVAAMIEGSVGYHSATHAMTLIEDIKNSATTDACERCMACFKGDLLAMVKYDLDGFSHVSQPKVDRLVNAVSQLGKLSPVQQMTFGLMYPTTRV
ncbi:MAG: hypothetical protein WAW23_08430 [Candidatus Methanoperedens sp.]